MNTNGISDKGCLTDENLYSYLTRNSSGWRTRQLDAHLAECPKCRKALADLIELLHPDHSSYSQPIPDPTLSEIHETVQLIQNVSRKEPGKRNRVPGWVRWPIAAAAAISVLSVSLLIFQFYSEKHKSEEFFAEAKRIVDQSYTGASPSNLRLSLPFNITSGMRDSDQRGSLRFAENYLYQALAVRTNLVEAHLGLGYIHLNGAEYGKALKEFGTVLEIRRDDNRALIGRGVVQYEDALQSEDLLYRINRLKDALRDFDSVLQSDPNSVEARYNKVMVLLESGLRQEALQEIDQYLSRDSGSAWAGELKQIQGKLQLTQSSNFNRELNRAARMRDGAALSKLARLVPHKIPEAIFSSMRRSLQLESGSAPNSSETPSAADLVWAANTMESSYSESTGNNSLKSYIQFYVGLSPPERRLKRALDAEFISLVRLHQNGRSETILTRSKILETQYAKIKDNWQLMGLLHVRGNTLYVNKADFQEGEQEFLKMLNIAKKLNSPDFMAKALAGVASMRGQERRFDESLATIDALKNLADKYKLAEWHSYIAIVRGNQYRKLGQLDLALKEYAGALHLAARMADTLKMAEVLENSGLLMDYQGRLPEAGALYGLAAQLQDGWIADDPARLPEIKVRHSNLLLRQGDLAMRIGELDKAEFAFERCLDLSKSGMREVESRALVGMAEVHLRKKRFPQAKDMLDKAIAISESGFYADSEWKARFLKGRLLESMDRPKEALSLYMQSVAILERMRQNVSDGTLKYSFLNNRFDPFKSIVALFFNQGDNEKALEFVDRAKSTTLKEDLASTLSFSRTGEKLKAGYPTTLEYFFTNEGLLIFFSKQGHLDVSLLKISSRDLSLQINAFLDSIRRNDSMQFAELAGKLYEELILPMDQHLAGSKTEALVVLPDGPLHRLPFAGLRDANNRYLIEKAPIAYAPSRTILRYCLNAESRKEISAGRVMLIDGTQGLPFARDEMAYISKLFGGNVRSYGANDLSSIGLEARRSSILHFSGHAEMQQGTPALTLQTTPQRVFLDSREIGGWKCAANRLVNLAGCATATGPIAEGEAPWGLIPAFLNAGAPSIVASLMAVDDQSTKTLDCKFYDMLFKGFGKARALQSAQLALLGSARQHTGAGPQSWVPYILVGDPR